ncbi:MAG: hypothetical protein K9N09_06770 [Candidatus Cloacimonetes bacterium]|nr:hypothetical protein [Candidatus Cloacimonadota bacterium]MCF7814309.1 hypothetical protein [Candidatus Cloacimonadota bacterium]MCF7868386.1 hypothetical protein [Candidatus Cloacimonadota bacterium]MCF7883849.1 hypothetical protein [Candidatus Cloacimonadota bacterium]
MKILLILIFIGLVINLPAQNPWLGKDKVTHFAASTFLTYWSYGLSKYFMENNRNSSFVFSVSLTAFLGGAKEFSDKNIKKTKWSWHDVAYDLAGIITGVILVNNLR